MRQYFMYGPYLILGLLLSTSTALFSQQKVQELIASPSSLSLAPNTQTQIQVYAIGEGQKRVLLNAADLVLYVESPSTSKPIAEIDASGMLKALLPGEGEVIIIRPDTSGNYLRTEIPLVVNQAPASEILFESLPSVVYVGTLTPLAPWAKDALGFTIEGAEITLESLMPTLASIDRFQTLVAHKPGTLHLEASLDDLKIKREITVKANPIEQLSFNLSTESARTGDVLDLGVVAYNGAGKAVTQVPIQYSFNGQAANSSEFAEGLITPEGKFVAYQAGRYVLTATCGSVAAQKTIEISDRAEGLKQKIQLVGQGRVSDKHTSDLWVWEGVDGRDYCVTGTWGADGEAYFWDITDPANMIPIDTVKVDARTVNDVKVSEDGRICVISREGASNRKNGIFILDVTNPKGVKILSEFQQGLTGGVHNLFIYKNHVYALSNSERYDIINIENPEKPKKVGTFELDTPGHSIHDVWIEDGLAYSSNWHDGIQIVDIGNGMAGGTPSKPVKVASYAYPNGWNHAAFPYRDPHTGKFYVIGGDEAFPNGLNLTERPTVPAGWLHFIDFSDPKHPKEVAQFKLQDAGTHNFWVEGDKLYLAYYNAGLRVLDLSGELLGDLYKQGREIGSFLPADPQGYVPNAPMTWGPQPHKGHIFFSDWNSGLWSVKMEEKVLTN